MASNTADDQAIFDFVYPKVRLDMTLCDVVELKTYHGATATTLKPIND